MPHYSGTWQRPIPELPDPATLPFPANLIRQCDACDLRQGCRAPVPGNGRIPARVMLVGQNPGRNEDNEGRPFIGQAGQQLDSLLIQNGIDRADIFIGNTVRCLTPSNATPKPHHIEACAKWLHMEIGVVDPDIIVAMGAPAMAWFLGQGCGSVEHLHGKPQEVMVDGRMRIVLPSYHPAAAIHNSSLLRQLADDFRVLPGLIEGKPLSDYNVTDEYPNPDYRTLESSQREMWKVADLIAESTQVAVDTETVRQNTKLWSVQISMQPGTGWFLPARSDWDMSKDGRVNLWEEQQVIVHHYLADVKWLDIPQDNFFDSMVAAYLLGLPQGLKELASRLCGMKMKSYSDVVRPGQRQMSIDYLTEALTRDWADPPPIEETKWDNKVGKLVTKIKNPWHISRKMKKLLDETNANIDTDPYQRWRDIPELERMEVEKKLGIMPESSLADISIEDARYYATRDADATLRVKLKLEHLIREAGLDFVLHMDMGILPMVDEMMRTGMAADVEYFRQLSVEFDARMRAKTVELGSLVGHTFNPNSRLQVAQVVYEELGFKPTGFTPSKEISTDDQELKKTGHPVAKGIIEYRRLSKMKGTYADALASWAVPDANGIPRVHTTLKTTRVETGRLSSADPNLQNIPTRSKDGKLVKKGFVAPPGKVMLEADYCLVPSTRVLTEDWRWIRIDDVAIGDNLIGITEDCYKGKNSKNYKRAYAPTQVLAKSSRIANCYEIELADGTVLTCTGEHPWLTREPNERGRITQFSGRKTHSHSWGWVRTDALVPGRQLCFLVRPWDVDTSWDAGFIAGAFDGEGCLSIGRGNVLSFTQKINPLMMAVLNILGKRGYKFHALHSASGGFSGSGPVFSTWISNSNDIIKLLGTTRPPRLLAKSIGFLNDRVPNTSPVDIVSVKPVGQRRVVSLSTNTHTFVAEGFFTHNCQIEVVTQAHLANCKGLIDIFLRGDDPHTLTASKIFGVPYEEAKQDKYRYPTKRANFGVIYMIGAEGLSAQIEEYIADLKMDREPVEIEPWSVEDCQKFIDQWYKLYPEVRDYQMEKAAQARRFGYVTDLFGRRRFIPEVNSPIKNIVEEGLRKAANMPVTSTAQGIIKLAMGKLYRELPQSGFRQDVEIWMQIHDSLIDAVKDDSAFVPEYMKWKREIMTKVVELSVPIKVDFKKGKDWSSMEKVKEDK